MKKTMNRIRPPKRYIPEGATMLDAFAMDQIHLEPIATPAPSAAKRIQKAAKRSVDLSGLDI